jgi:hypothetical protein
MSDTGELRRGCCPGALSSDIIAVNATMNPTAATSTVIERTMSGTRSSPTTALS